MSQGDIISVDTSGAFLIYTMADGSTLNVDLPDMLRELLAEQINAPFFRRTEHTLGGLRWRE